MENNCNYEKRIRNQLNTQTWDGHHVPSHMHEPIVGYLVHGYGVGSFLQAVIDNDLVEAVARADLSNLRALKTIALFMHQYRERIADIEADRRSSVMT